jgi:hypothetical protein
VPKITLKEIDVSSYLSGLRAQGDFTIELDLATQERLEEVASAIYRVLWRQTENLSATIGRGEAEMFMLGVAYQIASCEIEDAETKR